MMFMSLPLAIMPKTLVFTALVLLHASLHTRSGWGGVGGWGGGGRGVMTFFVLMLAW